jgi:hypothetical protein
VDKAKLMAFDLGGELAAQTNPGGIVEKQRHSWVRFVATDFAAWAQDAIELAFGAQAWSGGRQ